MIVMACPLLTSIAHPCWSVSVPAQSPTFYGVDLTCLREKALDEYFAQPVVGYIHSGCLLSRQFVRHRVNFATCTPSELQSFDVPFRFVAERTGTWGRPWR